MEYIYSIKTFQMNQLRSYRFVHATALIRPIKGI